MTMTGAANPRSRGGLSIARRTTDPAQTRQQPGGAARNRRYHPPCATATRRGCARSDVHGGAVLRLACNGLYGYFRRRKA